MASAAQASTPVNNVHPIRRPGGKIPASFIQELLSRVDIVDVVGAAVQLKKNGQNHHGLCPFHNEQSPSFTVSQTKQFFHCFGCGAHGDAIKFLIEREGLSFVDAVKELAGNAGMELPQGNATEQPQVERINPVLFQKMQEASDYYRWALLRSLPALEYLSSRGIKPLTAVRFGIGYAPPGWQNLEDVFGAYDAVELQLVGLVVKNEDNRLYDRFRDRIMIPILSANGDVIGFGGRVLGDDKPKYLNSPESPLFDKGSELFGMPQALPIIRETGCAIVVEGYTDTMALSECGVRNTVATLGTATTPTHAKKLFRAADRVYFCFDGDSAGHTAAWRAMENSIPFLNDGTKSAFFVFLPVDEDPDSFIRQNGKEAFFKVCDAAMPLSEFLIKELIKRTQPDSAEGRARLISEARPLMGKFRLPQSMLLRLQLLKQLSSVSEFTVDELDRICPSLPVAV